MLLFLSQVDTSAGTIIGELLNQYGITGLGFGILLTIMLRNNKLAQKRIENLESQQEKQYTAHITDQKEMINDYIDLVKNKTNVLADLTGCLKAMKDTLERIERKSD